MTTPQRPQGMVLHTTSGSHPVDLAYVGVREDGLHVWHADTVLSPGQDLRITVDTLSDKTLVMLPLRGAQ